MKIDYEIKHIEDKGFKVLALGTGGGLKISPAERFYLSCAFVPNLFVQAKTPTTLDKLRSLNKKYDEIWGYTGEEDIRLMLYTPVIDKELEEKYKNSYPDCNTQTYLPSKFNKSKLKKRRILVE
ncbi:hypothetical protein [Natronospora cellulosivora (SeqCode)]